MSRVEKGSGTEQRLEAMRGEMMQTIRQGQRRVGLGPGCAIASAVGALVFFLVAAWLLAATGLLAVPGFSSAAYRQPAPSHLVQPEEPIETVVSRALAASLAAGAQGGDGSHVVLTVPEGSFTASLREALSQTDQALVDPAFAQAAVDKDLLELFLPFKDNPQRTALIVRMRLRAEAGALQGDAVSARLGALAVPDALTQAALQPAVRQSLGSFSGQLRRFLSITAVSFVPGAVRIEADLVPPSP